MATWTTIGLSFLVSAEIAAAIPSFTFPINSQVPPVARTSKPFNFTFSSTTCTSDSPPIQYTLSDAPVWLQLDSTSRTFSGIPDPEDTGPATFHLLAADTTGSASIPVTLVVSSDLGPGLGRPVADQLPPLSTVEGHDSLLLHPSSPLSLSFATNTFTNTNQSTTYYAFCANNAPLPSWINFDANSLSFFGTTPGLTSPAELPQNFEIQFTASDVIGFSGAITTFQIIVALHEFTFGSEVQTISVQPGTAFNYTGLQTDLTLDGKSIEVTPGLQQILAETPEWMSFDAKTLVLYGTPPESVISQSFNVTATDVYGDTANTTVYIEINGTLNLLQNTFIYASIGSEFNYSFSSTPLGTPDMQIYVDLGNTSSWLAFDNTTLALSGRIPDGLKPEQDQINITVGNGRQIKSYTLTLVLTYGAGNGGSSTTNNISTGTSIITSSSSRPTTRPHPVEGALDGGSQRRKVAAAVLLPLIAVLGFSLMLWQCRRRGWLRDSTQSPRHSMKWMISRPLMQDSTSIRAQSDKRDLGHAYIPSNPPKIEVPNLWVSDTPQRHSRTRSLLNLFAQPAQIVKRDSRQDIVQRHSSVVPSIRRESSLLPRFTILDEERMILRGRQACSNVDQGPYTMKKKSGIISLSPLRRFSNQVDHRSHTTYAITSNLFSCRTSGIGHGIDSLRYSSFKQCSRQNTCYSDFSLLSGFGHGKSSFKPQISGPPGFGKIGKSWHNNRSESWEDFTTSPANTTNGSMTSGIDPRHISTTLSTFPRPPTMNTFQSSTILESSGTNNRPTIRTISPSLQAFHKTRARYRQYQSPFVAGGPSSRKSSHSCRTAVIMNPPPESSIRRKEDRRRNEEDIQYPPNGP